MRLEIDLSPELEARLNHVAAGLGMDASEFIGRLVKSHLGPAGVAPSQPAVQAQAAAPAASVARHPAPPASHHVPAAAAAPQRVVAQPAAAYAAPAPPPYAPPAPVAARQPLSVPLASGPIPFAQPEPEPPGADVSELSKKFSAAVTTLHERARNEAKYNSARHAQTLSNYGGLETARILLRAESPGEYFKALWQRKRLDLSIEALVIENPAFQPLFTEQQVATARSRLRQCNYTPSIKRR